MRTDLRAAEVYAIACKAADYAILRVRRNPQLIGNTLWLYDDGDWTLGDPFYIAVGNKMIGSLTLDAENTQSLTILANALISDTYPVDGCAFNGHPFTERNPRICDVHHTEWSASKRFCEWVIASAAKVAR